MKELWALCVFDRISIFDMYIITFLGKIIAIHILVLVLCVSHRFKFYAYTLDLRIHLIIKYTFKSFKVRIFDLIYIGEQNLHRKNLLIYIFLTNLINAISI